MKNIFLTLAFVLFASIANAAQTTTVTGWADFYDHGCVIDTIDKQSLFLGSYNEISKNVMKCLESGGKVAITGKLLREGEFDPKTLSCKPVK